MRLFWTCFSDWALACTASPLTYSRLCDLLAEEGLLYTPERPQGVFVYTAGTLSGIPVKRGYVNRIFTLILADSWQEAEAYAHKLEGIIAGLGCS
nr:peptide ligase PGM1-related protein [Paenibacillus sp. 1-18]